MSTGVSVKYCALCVPNAPGKYRLRVEECMHGTNDAEGKRQFEERYAARNKESSGFVVLYDTPWADARCMIEEVRPELVTIEGPEGAKTRIFVDWSGYDQLREESQEQEDA